MALRLIEPGKPNQTRRSNHSRPVRDECLNENWFTSLAHTEVVIETWRRKYNDERPKKGLGGLTPTAYARRLMKETGPTSGTAWGGLSLDKGHGGSLSASPCQSLRASSGPSPNA